MDELIKEMQRLRKQEGVPLHFRRKNLNDKTVVTISYGYKRIAHNVSAKEGAAAVNAARWVHHSFVNP